MRKQEAVSDGETFGQRRAMGDRATAAAPLPNPGGSAIGDASHWTTERL